MHQQRGNMDSKIEELWRKSLVSCDLDDFIKQFYGYQQIKSLTFAKCLEVFRYERPDSSDDESSDDGEEEPTDSFVNGPLSMNTVDTLLLTIHECMTDTSNTNLQCLWKIVLDAEDLGSDDHDETPPTYEIKRLNEFNLTYEHLEVLRSLLSACRRGTIKLTKITLANVMGNIEDV